MPRLLFTGFWLFMGLWAAGPAHAATQTFAFTGAAQAFIVPAGVTTVTLELWGAQGGVKPGGGNNLGGFASGELAVTPGETLQIYVGGQSVGVAGGFNGGAAGQNDAGFLGTGGAGGGGATDVRRGAGTLADRILVAGGAGGSGSFNGQLVAGGAGGGLNGGDGSRAGGAAGGTGGAQGPGGAGICNGVSDAALAGTFGQGGTPVGRNCVCDGFGGGGG